LSIFCSIVVVSMGFSVREARLGLRACNGDVTVAVDYITQTKQVNILWYCKTNYICLPGNGFHARKYFSSVRPQLCLLKNVFRFPTRHCSMFDRKQSFHYWLVQSFTKCLN
jgi:hypothetical protein